MEELTAKNITEREKINRGWKVYSFRGREVAVRELRNTDKIHFHYCKYCQNLGKYLITELWDIKNIHQEVWSWCGKCSGYFNEAIKH